MNWLIWRRGAVCAVISESDDSLAALGANDFFYSNQYKSGSLDLSPTVRIAKISAYQLRRLWVEPIIKGDQYNAESEAYRVTIALFDSFFCSAIKRGSLPIILVFPDGADIARALSNRINRYHPLLSDFEERGYHHIDLLRNFRKIYTAGLNRYLRGHYTARGASSGTDQRISAR